ncbi:MAG: replication restart helicase PriA [Sphaerochaetaceae bacterium]
MFIDVVVSTPLRQRFTYSAGDKIVEVGQRVIVPFGRRQLVGFVVATHQSIEPTSYEIKPIVRVLDKEPLFGQELIELAQWVGRFYLCSEGEALSAMIPSGRREIEAPVNESSEELSAIKESQLTAEQRQVIEAVIESENKLHYVWGVTGSGKSEVFFRIAEHIIQQGGQVIYLVPEITLTHQIAVQLALRFGNRVAILHSALSPSQRLLQWRKIINGEIDIVIGARSAVFAPFANLKLIIIDEEHEGSYKASNVPRYHGRQVAQKRVSMTDGILVMGSATPSLEAYYMMQEGKVSAHRLTTRVAGGQVPTVQVIDMVGQKGMFSTQLISQIKKTLLAKRQVILFLNRRGYGHYFHCNACGYEMSCPRCSVSLIHHKKENSMMCHYCGYVRLAVNECPECRSVDIGYGGYGTQMVEQQIQQLFPSAAIARLDADTTKKRGEASEVLKAFLAGSIDILLGTQMVAKGLNFPKVDLVGIIHADSALHLPDFRSQERSFALIVQVSGRSGRFSDRGKVVVQTYNPENNAIKMATEGKTDEFYALELNARRQTQFPPYTRLVNFVLRGRNNTKCQQELENLKHQIESLLQRMSGDDVPSILGASPCPIERIAGSWRYHIVLRGSSAVKIQQVAYEVYASYKAPSGMYMEIDIDPLIML